MKRRLSEALHEQPTHIRIRARQSLKEAGKIFRDDTTIRANVPNLADGSAIAVQIMPYPERISRNDLVGRLELLMVDDLQLPIH